MSIVQPHPVNAKQPDYDGDGLIDPCPGAPGDIDDDCDVDLADHAIMAEEFTGPRT